MGITLLLVSGPGSGRGAQGELVQE